MNTLIKYTCTLVLISICLLSTIPVSSQTVRSGYFLKTLPARSVLNPALRPDQGYIGVPFLSNVYVNSMTNTFNLDHFIFPAEPKSLTFMHHDVSVSEFMDGVSEDNYISTDVGVTLLSAGWYRGDGFWTVDMGVKAHLDANTPKSLFSFAKEGFDDQEERTYNMQNTRGIGFGYLETGVGYSRPFLDNTLLVGLKGKFLLGLINLDADITDLSITGGPDQWTAISRATLKGSASGLKPTYDSEGKFDGLDMDDNLGISGYGVGLDVGGVYELRGIADLVPVPVISNILDNLTISAALTDIGFIHWSKDNAMALVSPKTEVVLPGDPSEMDDGYSLSDQFDDVIEELGDALNFQEDPKGPESRSTTLSMHMNWGLEYEILKDQLSAGVLSSTYFNASHNVTELTLAGNYFPKEWLSLALSYSFIYSKFNTFGLAVHLAPTKGIKFFLASDYIVPHVNSDWVPTTSKGLNLQFGFAVPLGERR